MTRNWQERVEERWLEVRVEKRRNNTYEGLEAESVESRSPRETLLLSVSGILFHFNQTALALIQEEKI